MSKHLAVPAGTPTQVAHSGKAFLRTVVAMLVPTLLLLAAAIPIITEYLGPYLPEAWIAWLAGAAGLLLALAALITKLMALAKARDFWEKLGLGTGVEKEPALWNENAIPGDANQAAAADPQHYDPIPGTLLKDDGPPEHLKQ